ncbi:MAG: hypothetical protein ACREMZ_02905 [Gemmatimonadales bacterium]
MAGLAGIALLVPGCSGTTGPTAGMLDVSLTTPFADDGGILLTVSGGPVSSVEAPGYRVYSMQLDPNTLRLIVAGRLGSGTIVRLSIPDVRQASRYVASIGQVAARSSYVQRDPTGYTVSLLP